MAHAPAPPQIAFRYRPVDSATGVSRATAKRLAEALGVDETQAIHMALHEMAVKLLPQYEADDGALTQAQLRAVKRHSAAATTAAPRSVRSSLFGRDPA